MRGEAELALRLRLDLHMFFFCFLNALSQRRAQFRSERGRLRRFLSGVRDQLVSRVGAAAHGSDGCRDGAVTNLTRRSRLN